MYIRVIVLTTLMLMFLSATPKESAAEFFKHQWSPTALMSVRHYHQQPGKYYVVQDNEGEHITITARRVMVGDEIYLPDGRHYRVKSIEGFRATARLLGRDEYYLSWQKYFNQASLLSATDNWKDKPVGLYHTHTDECYQPTSGSSAKPYEGDIYRVGEQMQQSLEKKGVNVVYYKTPHDPHDNGAYLRSRRTAFGILRNDPVALFDIHRDGVPDPSYYQVNIEGQQVAKVRFVIGEQNPNGKANTDFAKRTMAYMNKVYPGLIKDIYVGHGNYNQDLLSTAMLLEVGTHTNTLEECQGGIALFANTLPVMLGLTVEQNRPGPIQGPIKENNRSGWATVAWLLFIVVVGAVTFLWISTGSFKKSIEVASRTVREMLLLRKTKLNLRWYAKPNFKKNQDEDSE